MKRIIILALLISTLSVIALETATKSWVKVVTKGEYRVITPSNKRLYTTMSNAIPASTFKCNHGNETTKDNPAIFLPAIEDVYVCQWIGTGDKYSITGEGVLAE